MEKDKGKVKKREVVMDDSINIGKLKDMKISELNKIAKDLRVNGVSGLKKQELIFRVLHAQAEKKGLMFGDGVLEVPPGTSEIAGNGVAELDLVVVGSEAGHLAHAVLLGPHAELDASPASARKARVAGDGEAAVALAAPDVPAQAVGRTDRSGRVAGRAASHTTRYSNAGRLYCLPCGTGDSCGYKGGASHAW